MAKDTAHRTRQARAPVNKRQVAMDTAHTKGGRGTGKYKPQPKGWAHSGDAADRPGQQQGRRPKAAGPSPAGLHQGPWQTSARAMGAAGDR